ncbi:unnamed protein product, partial [Choristocarpus tenellus]
DVNENEGEEGDDRVARAVVRIVDGMNLNDAETSALRMGIARGDDSIKAAVELFRWVMNC